MRLADGVWIEPNCQTAYRQSLGFQKKFKGGKNSRECSGSTLYVTVCRPCWPELFALSRDLWCTHLNSYASAFARMYFAVVVYWRLARVIRLGPIEIISVLFPPFPPYNAHFRAELDSAQVFGAFSQLLRGFLHSSHRNVSFKILISPRLV